MIPLIALQTPRRTHPSRTFHSGAKGLTKSKQKACQQSLTTSSVSGWSACRQSMTRTSAGARPLISAGACSGERRSLPRSFQALKNVNCSHCTRVQVVSASGGHGLRTRFILYRHRAQPTKQGLSRPKTTAASAGPRQKRRRQHKSERMSVSHLFCGCSRSTRG
jgi:hypothetical protein